MYERAQLSALPESAPPGMSKRTRSAIACRKAVMIMKIGLTCRRHRASHFPCGSLALWADDAPAMSGSDGSASHSHPLRLQWVEEVDRVPGGGSNACRLPRVPCSTVLHKRVAIW